MSCDSESQRTVVPKKPAKDFSPNEIRTTKFTPITFVPLNLFEQFQRPSNIYFLIISILQAFPLSPYQPTAWVPLMIVLVVNAIKEAVEDFNRYRMDVRANTMKTELLEKTEISWKDVVVSNFIFLKEDDGLPADILIMATSDREGGACFIETAQLDGETNLKNREAVEQTHNLVRDGIANRTECGNILISAVDKVVMDLPNEKLEEVRGTITVKKAEFPISNKNVVLRGCVLKNTTWVIGLVVYTGMQTKLMKNNTTKAVVKHSSCERKTDKYTLGMFGFLVGLCIVGGVLNGAVFLFNYFSPEPWYLKGRLEDPAAGTFLGMLTFLVLLSQLIPISLNVTMEMVKVAHALLINYDEQMKYNNETMSCTEEKAGTEFKYASARTTNLSEDLGRIRYVFTDKTGTLTRNVMEFMKCSVKPGIVYGSGITEISRTLAKKKGERLIEIKPPKDIVFERGNNFYDPKVYNGAWQTQNNAEDLENFFRAIGICHTVIVKDDNGAMAYQASSPDEHALAMGAKGQGFVFKGRVQKDLMLEVRGKEEVHQILNICEFDSTRKRMSVVARDKQTGKLWLYCKGADSAVFSKLSGAQDWHPTIQQHVSEFALDGLRTLCITRKELSEPVYQDWNDRVVALSKSKSDDVEVEMSKLAEEMEAGLNLLGVTAVEDKLQEGVPFCIHTMLRANIMVWVLTGDKVETAVNIAMACSLLDATMDTYMIQGKESKAVLDSIKSCDTQATGKPPSQNGIAIDGASLFFALEEEDRVGLDTKGPFLIFALKCAAVVCCRVSPKQKAQVVELVRYKIKTLTLAIGDGANDVGMIKSAHIGVGIAGGMEGQQAVLASDYSIAQFKFLARLLLVHGRLDFLRISKLIPFAFYKNVSFALTNYWYQIFAAFSGVKFMEDNYTNLWNVMFTAFPIMALAIFDKDVRDHELAFYFPSMYQHGQDSPDFRSSVFAAWMLDAIVMSVMLLFFPLFMMDAHNQDGRVDGVWGSTFASFAAVCTGMNLRVLIESRTITWLHGVTVSGSIIVFWIFTLVYQSQDPEEIDSVKGEIWYSRMFYEVEAPDAVFWLVVFLCLIFLLAPAFALNAYKSMFRPTHALKIAMMEVNWRGSFVRMCQKVNLPPSYEEYREYVLYKLIREKQIEVELDNVPNDNATFTGNSVSEFEPAFLSFLNYKDYGDALASAGVVVTKEMVRTDTEMAAELLADIHKRRESVNCINTLDPTAVFAYSAGGMDSSLRPTPRSPNALPGEAVMTTGVSTNSLKPLPTADSFTAPDRT